ncbi:MAG TPA: hypothetical protein VHN37_12090 [Actinomycetota bacterium]|nr:hypothetical protein [Actinomycetota bacterium]
MGGTGHRLTIGAAVAVVVLAGCGSPESEARGGSSAAPSPTSSPAYLYSCVNTPFDPARLEGPGGLEKEDSELGQALRDLMETPDGDFLKKAQEWRVVVEDGDRVEAVGRAPGKHGYMHAIFERSGDSWKPAGWGDCKPHVVVGGRSPATWELVEEPSPDDTELVVDATERACASGRQLEEHQVRADVAYGEEAITIVVSADPLPGGECPENPPVRLTVPLDEPVGDRILLDAAVFPPARRYP